MRYKRRSPGTREGRAFWRFGHPLCRSEGRTRDPWRRLELPSRAVAAVHLGALVQHYPTPPPSPPRQTLPNRSFARFLDICGQLLGRVFDGAMLIRGVAKSNPLPAHSWGNPSQTLIFAAVATANLQKVVLPPPRKMLFLARKRPTLQWVQEVCE